MDISSIAGATKMTAQEPVAKSFTLRFAACLTFIHKFVVIYILKFLGKRHNPQYMKCEDFKENISTLFFYMVYMRNFFHYYWKSHLPAATPALQPHPVKMQGQQKLYLGPDP